jgi:DhnA family fructose-bisphosphate aldolase class Ia
MPVPTSGVAQAVAACGIPVILAGGAFAKDRRQLYADVEAAVKAGAAGVAFGRNVWGDGDPSAVVRALVEAVHGRRAAA